MGSAKTETLALSKRRNDGTRIGKFTVEFVVDANHLVAVVAGYLHHLHRADPAGGYMDKRMILNSLDHALHGEGSQFWRARMDRLMQQHGGEAAIKAARVRVAELWPVLAAELTAAGT